MFKIQSHHLIGIYMVSGFGEDVWILDQDVFYDILGMDLKGETFGTEVDEPMFNKIMEVYGIL